VKGSPRLFQTTLSTAFLSPKHQSLISVKTRKATQSTDPNPWPGLILSPDGRSVAALRRFPNANNKHVNTLH